MPATVLTFGLYVDWGFQHLSLGDRAPKVALQAFHKARYCTSPTTQGLVREKGVLLVSMSF